MKVKDLRQVSSEELVQKERSFKKELFDLNYQRKTGRVEKSSRFSLFKKDIARILTILKEREVKK